jgi:hypothetical protein
MKESRRESKANAAKGLRALKVGDPVAVARYLGFA